MENVVALDDRRAAPESQPLICVCGSQWFDLVIDNGPGAVTLNREGSVTGYAGSPRCRECGRNVY